VDARLAYQKQKKIELQIGKRKVSEIKIDEIKKNRIANRKKKSF
jgi:hypothetical protein